MSKIVFQKTPCKEPLDRGYDLNVAKARLANLTLWPDLDMVVEARKNPRHLRIHTSVARNGAEMHAENISPQFVVGSSSGTKRNNLIGWKAM